MSRATIVWLVCLGMIHTGCGSSPPREKTSSERIAAAMKISDPVRRTGELVKIASAQQQAGDVLDVRSTLLTAAESARSIPSPGSRASGLISVAGASARADEKDEARRLLADAAKAIGEIPEAGSRIQPLTSLATATAEHLGDVSQARQYLQQAEQAAAEIKSAVVRARGVGAIAAGYARLPDTAEAERVSQNALKWAEALPSPREQADSLAEIGGALAKSKQAGAADAFAAARQAAARIESDEGRAYALLNLGRKLKAAGDAAQSQSVLAEAKLIAEGIKDASIRGPLLAEPELAGK